MAPSAAIAVDRRREDKVPSALMASLPHYAGRARKLRELTPEGSVEHKRGKPTRRFACPAPPGKNQVSAESSVYLMSKSFSRTA